MRRKSAVTALPKKTFMTAPAVEGSYVDRNQADFRGFANEWLISVFVFASFCPKTGGTFRK
jgi:hypothetical protein